MTPFWPFSYNFNNYLEFLPFKVSLIGIDGEWGINMRIDSTPKFPWNMSLGALKDNGYIEKIGKSIGNHSKRMLYVL